MLIVARGLIGLSGLLLLADAYLHSTGVDGLERVLSTTNIPGFYARALPTLWIFFSWHLIVVALPLLWSAISNPQWFLPVSVFCGFVVLGDLFWVYSAAGWFPGSVILAVALGSIAAAMFCLSLANKASAAKRPVRSENASNEN